MVLTVVNELVGFGIGAGDAFDNPIRRLFQGDSVGIVACMPFQETDDFVFLGASIGDESDHIVPLCLVVILYIII